MKIKVSKNLIRLSLIFGKNNPLFVVGGYVRDSLLKLKTEDVDICSALSPAEVKLLLKDTGFKITDKNLKFGTLIIEVENEKFEYTTFRTEVYENKGKHSPKKVCFSQSIVDDVKRRDFTINGIYYNIISDQIIDFYGGLSNLKDGTIKAIGNADDKFKDDGIRILRMIRFASELNFTIDQKTYEAAVKYLYNLNSVSVSKKCEEFLKIIKSKNKHSKIKNAGYYGLRLIDKLSLWNHFGKKIEVYERMLGLSSFLNDYEKAISGEEVLAFLLDGYEYLYNLNLEKFNLKIFIENVLGENSLSFILKERSKLSKQIKILVTIFGESKCGTPKGFYKREQKQIKELLPFIKRHSYALYKKVRQKLNKEEN